MLGAFLLLSICRVNMIVLVFYQFIVARGLNQKENTDFF